MKYKSEVQLWAEVECNFTPSSLKYPEIIRFNGSPCRIFNDNKEFEKKEFTHINKNCASGIRFLVDRVDFVRG